MDWTIPCREAAALMVAREDRPLALGERAALRWHLVLCRACTRFDGQMTTMRHSLDQWRSYREATPVSDHSEDPPGNHHPKASL